MSNDTRLELREVSGLLKDMFDRLAGPNGSEWLNALKRFLRRENPWEIVQPHSAILPINRSTPFDLMALLGGGWSIEEQDSNALALTEIDLSKIELTLTLKEGESSVNGEENLRRLKNTGNIRLDAKVFETLRQNKKMIPESWKGKYVYFHGTVLRNPRGHRCVLYLYRNDGKWYWNYDWLDNDWNGRSPSAVLAK